MSEYVVDFGDKSTAFVGLAMAEAESHGATLMERVVRCRDCEHYHDSINGCAEFGDESRGEFANVEPNGYCAWGVRRDA